MCVASRRAVCAAKAAEWGATSNPEVFLDKVGGAYDRGNLCDLV